jgi:hypothetical protein
MMKKMTAMPFDERAERAAARRRFDAYLTGTLSVLDVGGWETQEVCLGLTEGVEDHILAHYQGGDGEDMFRIALLVSREGLRYFIDRPGDEGGVRGHLAPGVPAPTPQEARELYFEAARGDFFEVNYDAGASS